MSKQLDFFESAPSGRAPGWYRYEGVSRYPIYELEPEGWSIHLPKWHHDFPYYIETPGGERIAAHHGRGFFMQKDAEMAVRAYLDGLVEIAESRDGRPRRLMWDPWKMGAR